MLTTRKLTHGGVRHYGPYGTATVFGRWYWMIEDCDGVKNLVYEEGWAIQYITQGHFTVLAPDLQNSARSP